MQVVLSFHNYHNYLNCYFYRNCYLSPVTFSLIFIFIIAVYVIDNATVIGKASVIMIVIGSKIIVTTVTVRDNVITIVTIP